MTPSTADSRDLAFTIVYKQNMVQRDLLDTINEYLTPEPASPKSRSSKHSQFTSQLSQFKYVPMTLRPSLESRYTDNVTEGLSVYKAAKQISVKMPGLKKVAT